jgi:hypothetical protein
MYERTPDQADFLAVGIKDRNVVRIGGANLAVKTLELGKATGSCDFNRPHDN